MTAEPVGNEVEEDPNAGEGLAAGGVQRVQGPVRHLTAWDHLHQATVGQVIRTDAPLYLRPDAASMVAASTPVGKVLGWIGKDLYISRDMERDVNFILPARAEAKAKGGKVVVIPD